MIKNTKEVYFNEFCPKCKYSDIDETDDPCNECLIHGSNENTHRPVMYVEDKDK